MLKIIKFIFILFSGFSLIITASLFTGFEIDNLSYKNIFIKKLYLKYDKKLNISTPEITIYDLNSDASTKIRTTLTIDYTDKIFEIDVKNFQLYDSDLKFKGLIFINKDEIDLENKTEAIIKNANIIFDKQMEQINTKKIFLVYENNKIDLQLEKPYYGDVDISNTTVSYLVDTNILQLYLQTNSLINDTLKNALLRYGVDIPLTQYNGKNDIFAKVFIPFGEGELYIESHVKIKNSTLESYDQKFDVSKVELTFKDSILKGDLNLTNYKYQDINISDTLLNYKVSFENGIKAFVDTNSSKVSQNDTMLYINDLVFHFNKNQIELTSKIKDDKNKLFINLNNQTNLETKKLQGEINITFEDKENNTSIHSDTIVYNGDFLESFQIKLFTKNINMTKPQTIALKDVTINFQDNLLNTNLFIKDPLNLYDIELLNKTNLETKKSLGNLNLNKIKYKNLVNLKNKTMDYDISYDKNITIYIPSFGLEYSKLENSQTNKLIISNPNKILDIFTFLEHDNKNNGYIDIVSEDFNDTIININNFSFDINSSYLQSIEKNTTQLERLILPLFPKIDLTYKNSDIKYDNFTLAFDTFKLNTNQNKSHIQIKQKNNGIDIKTLNNSIFLKAENMSDIYINRAIGKEILKDGFLNLNIYGDDINTLSGDINFHKTTIKNVTIVNSLLTFVNTTPAIINPLLALPTLFRMAETGFDTNGYYMKNGSGSFRYDLATKQLDVYDLYTNGKMSNFIVNAHLNLQTNKINSNVDISFLKDFSKAIRHIPVLGYIVMGEDGEFHTSVDITGTLDNPSLETHTVKEATKGVTGVVKRILTLPLLPFQGETTEQQKKDHQKRVDEILK